MRDVKDFFRNSRRIFEELDAEEHAERTGQRNAAEQAERRERIATAVLQGALAGQPGDMPTMTPREAAQDAIAYADALIHELDKEAADAD